MLPRKPCRIEPPKPPLNHPSMARLIALSRLMCSCDNNNSSEAEDTTHPLCVIAGYLEPYIEPRSSNYTPPFYTLNSIAIDELKTEGLAVLISDYDYYENVLRSVNANAKNIPTEEESALELGYESGTNLR